MSSASRTLSIVEVSQASCGIRRGPPWLHRRRSQIRVAGAWGRATARAQPSRGLPGVVPDVGRRESVLVAEREGMSGVPRPSLALATIDASQGPRKVAAPLVIRRLGARAGPRLKPLRSATCPGIRHNLVHAWLWGVSPAVQPFHATRGVGLEAVDHAIFFGQMVREGVGSEGLAGCIQDQLRRRIVAAVPVDFFL